MSQKDEPQYDVAISFNYENERIALDLSVALTGRFTTFVSSERKRETLGQDGVDLFSRVFKRDSRIVVVLLGTRWGSRPFTRIEETAIKDRGLEAGWDFLLVVPLEGRAIPEWVPKAKLWVDLERCGTAELVGVIEQRILESGGVRRRESPLELAARLRQDQDAEALRLAFLGSIEGVNCAEKECAVLFDEIERLVRSIRESVSMPFDRRGHQSAWMFHAGHTIGVHWVRLLGNTLTDSVLTVEKSSGRVGPSYYSNERPVKLLDETLFDFNVDVDRKPFWESRDGSGKRLSSIDLAEAVVTMALRPTD